MKGDTFSIKAPKNALRGLLPLSKGNPLPEEMFLEYSFVLRRCWGDSIEKVLPLNLL